jgi:hypothetical protein
MLEKGRHRDARFDKVKRLDSAGWHDGSVLDWFAADTRQGRADERCLSLSILPVADFYLLTRETPRSRV